ncbi:MAG: cob(I)yrinic acid a,c-diamide adenosyltransferase [Vicinamibacterales bacterium]
MKIYTRTGDRGETALVGGARVSKADPLVDAYGEVDELNACIGLARTTLPDADLDEILSRIQQDLFALGAQLADPLQKTTPKVAKAWLGDTDVERLEQWIDRVEGELPPLTQFILPGGLSTGATLHLARAVCRRGERRIAGLQPPVNPVLLRYVNRLSDLLFVLARAANRRQGKSEQPW